MECAKVQTCIRKSKKKQVKDELDRIKQAEKKKRRLEKALATSAAIRSELEKKKQKKKEEQQRLDEEGAAIAEAVALHVLLGEDEDPHQVMRDHCSSFDQELSQYSLEFSDAHRYGYMWTHQGNSDWIVSSSPRGRDFLGKYFEDEGWHAAGLSPGLIAAQGVSSLQIADDSNIDTYLFNRTLNGSELVDGLAPEIRFLNQVPWNLELPPGELTGDPGVTVELLEAAPARNRYATLLAATISVLACLSCNNTQN